MAEEATLLGGGEHTGGAEQRYKEGGKQIASVPLLTTPLTKIKYHSTPQEYRNRLRGQQLRHVQGCGKARR